MSDAPARAMTPVGVNHLVLNVRDIDVAHEFWTEVMGFRHIGSLKPRSERSMNMRFYNGLSESHHDLALAEIMGDSEDSGDWSMAPKRPGLNHLAVHYPDRDSWLKQIAFLQAKGVKFNLRINHGMTHSVYINDPDGHGIEVLYELPREDWEADIDGALNYADMLPTEGAEALVDEPTPVFAAPGVGD